MKRLLPILALATGLIAATAQALSTPGKLVDSFAAIVNGKVITVGDVLQQLQPAMERLAMRHQGAELSRRLLEEYHAVRETLVESELILLDFESKGGNLPDRAIEDHVNSVIFERFNNDRAAFLRALAAERLTFAEWRRQMKEQLIVQMMLQQTVQSKIVVTPFDVKQAYQSRIASFSSPERVELRTLVFGSAQEAEGRDESRARMVSGPEWFDVPSLNDAIRAAVASLSPGEFADALAGDTYSIQLVSRQASRIRPLDEVAPEIERELRRAEFNRLRRIWLDSLRSKYFVQLYAHDVFE